MVWYIIVIAAVVVFLAWFVRTPTYRHLRQRKDPGQSGTHQEGSMLNADRNFRKND
ncbi:MAG: hypothetical protein QM747_05095 [Nocardioides sp.]